MSQYRHCKTLPDIPAIVYGVGEYGIKALQDVAAANLFRVSTMELPVSGGVLDELRQCWDSPVPDRQDSPEGDPFQTIRKRHEALFEAVLWAELNIYILDPAEQPAVDVVKFLASCQIASGKLIVGMLKKPPQRVDEWDPAEWRRKISCLYENIDCLLEYHDDHSSGNEYFVSAVRGIAEFHTLQGIINQKLCDMGHVLRNAVLVTIGTGLVSGIESVAEAARQAFESAQSRNPGGRSVEGILINITSDRDGIHGYDLVCEVVKDWFPDLDNIVINHLKKNDMQQYVRVTVMMAYLANRGRPSY